MAAVPTGAPGGAGDASELDVDPIKSLLDLSLDARAAWQHSEHRAHFAADSPVVDLGAACWGHFVSSGRRRAY